MTADGYLLDDRAGEAEDRFAALSSLFDPVTFRHVDALGRQVRDELLEQGTVSAADVDRYLELTSAGAGLDLTTSPLVSAWGRRPS